MAASSYSVSTTSAAAMFSRLRFLFLENASQSGAITSIADSACCARATYEEPGMGMTCAPSVRTQLMASCAGVAAFFSAIPLIALTNAMLWLTSSSWKQVSR